ncbi:hypothetical protein IJ579_02065 [bacterium]|nr:hypothetical protein [bacterium]
MVKVGGTQDGGSTPKGYTKLCLFNNKTRESKTYFIPIGQKVHFNGKTYDPSKTRNNQFTITGDDSQDKFKLIGLALEHMDANGDGKIDKQDTDENFADTLSKGLIGQLKDYFIKDVPDVYSDAGLYDGNGAVIFSKGDVRMPDRVFEFRIDNEDD